MESPQIRKGRRRYTLPGQLSPETVSPINGTSYDNPIVGTGLNTLGLPPRPSSKAESPLNIAEVIALKRRQEREEKAENEAEYNAWIEDGILKGFLNPGREYGPRSLGCFDMKHPLRLWCIRIIESKLFEAFILLIILLNTIMLLVQEPGVTGEFFTIADMILASIFLAEAALKTVALGFVKDKDAYLRNHWNQLDFIISIMGLFAFFPQLEGNYTGIRALRVLRPLRTLTHVEGLRTMVNSIIMSIPLLADVSGLGAVFIVVFSILGVDTFNGALHSRCYLPTPANYTLWPPPIAPATGMSVVCGNDSTSKQCPSLQICLQIQSNPNYLNYGITNFDNIGWSFLSLFQSITEEGWADIMYSYREAVGWIAPVFFVLFVFIGSFFLLNLTLAVITQMFARMSTERENIRNEKKNGTEQIGPVRPKSRVSVFLTGAYARCMAMVLPKVNACTKRLRKFKLPKFIVKPCKFIADFPWFQRFIMFLIFFNLIILAMEYYGEPGMSPIYELVLSKTNFVMTLIFVGEMVLKMVGYGLFDYWADKFNRFDFLIVAISLVELGMEGNAALSAFRGFRTIRILRVFRTLRVLRAFRLVRWWKNLSYMLAVIYRCMSDLAWFVVFLALFIVIFAILGMQLFGGRFKFKGEEIPRLNFDTAGSSLVTVFVILTGESWNNVMYSAIRLDGYAASIYFICLVVIGNFILFNLFLAILLENFAEEQQSLWQKRADKVRKRVARLRKMTLGLGSKKRMTKYKSTPTLGGLKRAVSLLSRKSSSKSPDPNTIELEEIKVTSEKDTIKPKAMHRSGSMVEKGIFSAPPSKPPLSPKQSSSKNEGVFSPIETWSPGRLDQRERHSESNDMKGSGIYRTKKLDQRKTTSTDIPRPSLRSPVSKGVSFHSMEDKDKSLDSSPSSVEKLSSSPTPSTLSQTSQRSSFDIDNMGKSMNADASDSGFVEDFEIVNNSLCCFSPKNRLRLFCHNVVTSPKFEWMMLGWITASTILLAFESPTLTNQQFLMALNILDWIFAFVFLLECVMKVIAFGFVLGQDTYMRNRWNLLDFFIVIIAFVALILTSLGSSADMNALRSLRAFRVLRPLRYLSKSVSMRTVVAALLRSLPSIANAMAVCLLFWIIFGIVAVQMLGGRFYSCTDTTIITQDNCIGSYNATVSIGNSTAVVAQREWVTPLMNFDNIINSLLTLFQLATNEGWPDVMFAGMDATDPGQAPSFNAQPAMAVFFILFIIFGSFFILNLFVGVVVDTYNMIQAEQSGSALLTPAQVEWIRTQRRLMTLKPIQPSPPPSTGKRRYFYNIAMSEYFDRLIIVVIIVNIIQMATNHYPLSPIIYDIFYYLNFGFTGIYILEALLKLIGLGMKGYFRDNWNRLDFLIVTMAVVDLFFTESVGFVKVLRILRIARILKLVRRAEGIKAVLRTIWVSLPSLWNIGQLLFLVFFIFSVLGVSFFGNVKYNGPLNENANFRDFIQALLLLFRVSTGEEWQELMNACRIQPPYCSEELGNCGSSAAPVFFVSFIVIETFVVLNLFVAVVLENFASHSNATGGLSVHPEDIRRFQEIWAKYDPKVTYSIQQKLLVPMLIELGPPLGLGGKFSESTRIRLLSSLEIPVTSEGNIHFVHTAVALVKRLARMNEETVSEESLHVLNQIQGKLSSKLPSSEDCEFTVAEWASAVLVQKRWRVMSMELRERRITSMRRAIGKTRDVPFLQRSSPSKESKQPRIASGLNTTLMGIAAGLGFPST